MLDKINESNTKREERKNKKLYVFVDFYNLNLVSGYKWADVKMCLKHDADLTKYAYFPEEEEKKKVMDFLHRYNQELEIDKSWFNSRDFLEFVEEYRHVCNLINGYISGKIFGSELVWLNNGISKAQRLLYRVKSGDEEHIRINNEKPEYEYDLKEWKIKSEDFIYYDRKYGIKIDDIMSQIHFELLNMLETELSVKYCSLEEGKRNLSCNNIFIPNKKDQKFCSDKCRLEYHNTKKADYMKKKRDPESPIHDPKYLWWR